MKQEIQDSVYVCVYVRTHTHVSALCTLYIHLPIFQPHIHVLVEGLPCARCFVLWLIRQQLGKISNKKKRESDKRHVWWAGMGRGCL